MEKALNQFQDNVKHKQILLRTDNSKVVSYINRKGGTKSVVLYLWHGGFCIGGAFGQHTFPRKGMR